MKTVVKVLDARSRRGLCPRWHKQSGSLYWLDASGQRLNAWQAEYDRFQTLPLQEVILVNRRVFHRFSSGKGMPAGAAIDEGGGLWVAMFSGEKIVRLSPGGVVVEEILS